MNENELIQIISKDFAVDLPLSATHQELVEKLSVYINELIQNNFQQLVFILYKIDVSETKLKHLLQESPNENAGKLIAELIIERQQQKLSSRKNFRPNEDIPDEEKW